MLCRLGYYVNYFLRGLIHGFSGNKTEFLTALEQLTSVNRWLRLFNRAFAEKSSFFSSVANSVICWELNFSIAQNVFGILLTHFSSQDSYSRFRSHCDLKNGLNIFELETITKLNILTQTRGFPIDHKTIINLCTVSRTFHSPFFGFKRRSE